MLRQLLGAGVLLATLAGCTKLYEGAPCATDDDCGSGGLCDMSVGLCYLEGTEPEADGGVCSPACAAYEACNTRGDCVARFKNVEIQEPLDGGVFDGGTVQVRAQLHVEPNFEATTQLPETLTFSASRSDDGGVGTFGTVSRNGSTYTVPWTLPSGQAEIALTAAYPDPAAEVNYTVNVTVDTVPPVFTIMVPDGGSPPMDGGFSQTDTRDPTPGYEAALRRNESVTVTVTANEPLSSATLTVVGIGAGGGPGAAQTPVTLTHGGTCPGSPAFCSQATVNLAEPEMRMFRGNMRLQVNGQDRVGNSRSDEVLLPVTRWKWVFAGAAGEIKASPAIGKDGAIYFGTASSSSEGKVIALAPEGAKKWEATVGAVASVAVGNADGGVEPVYAAANTAATQAVLYVLSGEDGGTNVRCPASGAHPGKVSNAMAIMSTTVLGTPYESGVAVINNNPTTQLFAVRPAASEGNQCAASNLGASIPQVNPESSMVARDSTFIYPTEALSVVSYNFGSDNPNWTATSNGQPIHGLAVDGQNLVGGGGALFNQGGVFSVPLSGAATATLLPGTDGGRVWNPVIGPGPTTAFFGQDTAGSQSALRRYDLTGQTVSDSESNLGTLRYAPVLGADGVLYTAESNSSAVAAWSTDTLDKRWDVILGGAANSASLALDCARNVSGGAVPGRPGTLYVPAGGSLYAIIVDSRGLANAPWPKFQRDARNTGNSTNSANPITNCP